tara:strand:+ start:559 stop:993 length:435 start_codon:yes stop_codon:yes gene_type:complete
LNSKVPLPTDNIYKFYSLFGLVLLITSCILFIQTYNSFQQSAFERYIELEVLKSQIELSSKDTARKTAFETQAKIDVSNKDLYMQFIGAFIGFSFLLIFYGFKKWHQKIQPQQDLITQLQIDKLTIEISMLKKNANKININKLR